MIRVFVAEDKAMVRSALKALLALEEDIVVVAEVSRGDEVVEAAVQAKCSTTEVRWRISGRRP
jgi:two-component system, NarL family, response regulator DesR